MQHPGANHVILTLYAKEKDCIGWHADKTESFEAGSDILLMSLGQTREFHLRNNETQKVTVVIVEAGDLFVLGWETNKTFQHSIVPYSSEIKLDSKRGVAPRISICWRNIAQTYTSSQIAMRVMQAKKSKVYRRAKKHAMDMETKKGTDQDKKKKTKL